MTVTLNGKFTEEELKELATWLRKIQNAHPEEDYFMFIEGLTENMKPEEAIEKLKQIFPRVTVAG